MHVCLGITELASNVKGMSPLIPPPCPRGALRETRIFERNSPQTHLCQADSTSSHPNTLSTSMCTYTCERSERPRAPRGSQFLVCFIKKKKKKRGGEGVNSSPVHVLDVTFLRLEHAFSSCGVDVKYNHNQCAMPTSRTVRIPDFPELCFAQTLPSRSNTVGCFHACQNALLRGITVFQCFQRLHGTEERKKNIRCLQHTSFHELQEKHQMSHIDSRLCLLGQRNTTDLQAVLHTSTSGSFFFFCNALHTLHSWPSDSSTRPAMSTRD